jgi:nicotinamide-nucleotide amidase
MGKAVLAAKLLDICRKKSLRIVTAESCTGGMISAALTDIPGSSDVFERGFVTYSNSAKAEMLGVKKSLITKNGAVSEQVASAMAAGALKKSTAHLSVAVTGIAGPGGGSKTKPVGLVYIATCRRGKRAICRRFIFKGTRKTIRNQAVNKSVELLIGAV